MRKLSFILSILMLFCLCSCGKNDTTDETKITVAVTIGPEAEFVNKICKQNAEIITMLPAGASPETYEITPKEAIKLQEADIYFAIGVAMEQNSVLNALPDNLPVIELHKSVSSVYPDLLEGEHRDPHIWLSVKRVKVMVEKITAEIILLDPDNAQFYKQNSQEYLSELNELENEIGNLFANKKERKFIVFHPAFSYFANDFSLFPFALEQHGKEITPKHLANMVDFARNNKIKTIFYQAEASARQPLAFAKEIGGEAVILNPLESNYTKNMKEMAKAIAKAMK